EEAHREKGMRGAAHAQVELARGEANPHRAFGGQHHELHRDAAHQTPGREDAAHGKGLILDSEPWRIRGRKTAAPRREPVWSAADLVVGRSEARLPAG